MGALFTSSLHRSIPAKWSFFSKEKERRRLLMLHGQAVCTGLSQQSGLSSQKKKKIKQKNKKGGGCSCFIHKQFAPVYPSKVVFLLKRKRKLKQNKIKIKIKKEAAAHALFTSSL